MKKLLLAATMLGLLVGTANADAIKFYNGGGTAYNGPFEGSGATSTIYQQTQGLATSCPGGGGSCSSDVVQNMETFNAPNSVTITAAASSLFLGFLPVVSNVIGDFSPTMVVSELGSVILTVSTGAKSSTWHFPGR